MERVVWVALGAVLGSLGTWYYTTKAQSYSKVYELNGLYYQKLGEAWNHGSKCFQIIYRPLYHCKRQPGRFEAHLLAISNFDRFETKFAKVDWKEVPMSVRRMVLAGPFVFDPAWTMLLNTHETAGLQLKEIIGSGNRTHEKLSLQDVIGDYKHLIDVLKKKLIQLGLQEVTVLEMDHICYRCETIDVYIGIRDILQNQFGILLVEGMIGGRPISIIELHEPIVHNGFSVSCLEIPCPKPGTRYTNSLEHGEIVIGSLGDSISNNKNLKEFVARHKDLNFDTRSLNKHLNADVSLTFMVDDDPLIPSHTVSVKFHGRPIYEVVKKEIQDNLVERVPPAYFDSSKGYYPSK